MGDYKYFRYLKDITIDDIEYIKLIAEDSECDVKNLNFRKRN